MVYTHIRQLAAIQIEYARGKSVDKITVVGYDKHGAVKAVDGRLKSLSGGDIKMVCRLVKYKQIHVRQYQLCQRQTGSLTAAEHGYLLENRLADKAEQRQRVAYFYLGQTRIGVPQLVNHRVFRREILVFLVVVADLDVISRLDATAERLYHANYHFDKRRFSAAVGTRDKNALVLFYEEINVREQNTLAVSAAKRFGGEYLVSA